MILLEIPPRTGAELFRASLRTVRWWFFAGIISFLFIIMLPDPRQLLPLPFALLFICLFYSLVQLALSKKYIYKVILDGNLLHFHYSKKGKEGSFSLGKDNFKVSYSRGKQYTVFHFEQKRPYKSVFLQYGFGHWKQADATDFLAPYGQIITYKGEKMISLNN